MANRIYEEPFVGAYDGVSPVTLMPKGSIADGLNVRKIGPGGGWKPRRGCTLHNTTTIAAANVLSLHQYRNPLQNESFFLAQCDGDLKYNTATQPPTAAAIGAGNGDNGADIITGVSTTVPGFSCTVGEFFCYADGTKGPIIWGGTAPRPLAFILYDADADSLEDCYLNFTQEVVDNRSDTEAPIGQGSAADLVYVIANEPINTITITIGATVNEVASTTTVYAWRGTDWAAVTSPTDGTISPAGKTLGKSGSITWTLGADEMIMIGGVLGYAYKLVFSVALTTGTSIQGVTVGQPAAVMTNKWNGVFEWVQGCRYYGGSEYIDCFGKVTNEATSLYIDVSGATTTDFIYIRTFEPAAAFGILMAPEYENTEDVTLSLKYWDGNSWEALTIVDDTANASTDTLSRSGVVYISNANNVTPIRRTIPGDPVPGYWYRFTFSAALGAAVRIYSIVFAPFPKTLPTYDGCVEFKGRLALWGDPEFPNYIRFSAKDRPDCFSGSDTKYIGPFGDKDEILNAIPFYNELLIFKRGSIFMLEGYSPATFGILKITDTVGLSSPKTAHIVEVGTPGLVRDEGLSIALWQDVDGVYALDGRKPKKVSDPVGHYFNPEDSTCIAATDLRTRQAFVDRVNDEYHLLLPAAELVYNYATGEWYPPWSRAINLNCGLCLRGSDNRFYTYGGSRETGTESEDGFILKLETGTTDRSAANGTVAISHSIKTRALPFWEKEHVSLLITLRKLWIKVKAQTAGTVITKLFKNLTSTGVVLSAPEAMSMIATGAGIAVPKLDVSSVGCSCFQVEFSLATKDQEMLIWGLLYELEMTGLFDS